MKVIYKCEFCASQFTNKESCRSHEISHLNQVEKTKYILQNMSNEDICAHCKNVFYVYGCEKDCMFDDCGPHNNYKDFVGEIKND